MSIAQSAGGLNIPQCAGVFHSKWNVVDGSSSHADNAMFKARGANDTIRVAVIGVGSRGSDHIREFSRIEGVQIVAVCDADHIL